MRVRLDFIKEGLAPEPAILPSELPERLRGYYERHLGTDLIALLAEEGGLVVASAMLLIIERPASHLVPSGLIGELANVYTYPAYRHRGLALRLVGALIEKAQEKGLSKIQLGATKQGFGVYAKLGFEVEAQFQHMVLKLIP